MRRHFEDDAWFHASAAFVATSAEVADLVRPLRDALPALRPSFVAHVLVEMLLDAELVRRDAGRFETYYATLAQIDADEVERLSAPLATKPPTGLAPFVRAFVSSRFLADYADDPRLVHRLDQVGRRLRQPALGAALVPLLPAARAAVAAHTDRLLPGDGTDSAGGPLSSADTGPGGRP